MSQTESSLLTPPPQHIAIRPEHITPTQTTLKIKQNEWSRLGQLGLSFTIKSGFDNSHLFTVSEVGRLDSTSASTHTKPDFESREFKDASGLPLFTLRRKWMTLHNAWYLELPGGGGKDMLSTKIKLSWTKTKFDVIVQNASTSTGHEKRDKGEDGLGRMVDGGEVKLEVRGQDLGQVVTHVMVGDRMVVDIRRNMDDPLLQKGWGSRKEFRPEWEVQVAQGMDLCLVSVIVVILSDLVPAQMKVPK